MIKIIDNFYNNADAVRAYALSLDFSVSGNYPGMRTEALKGDDFTNAKAFMENAIGMPITYWPDNYNTAFQYTTEDASTWIHHDGTQWAAVLYLTPDAPIESGTGIYKHRHTGIYKHSEDAAIDFNEYASDQDDWDMIAMSGNIYNRMVIYEGSYYHRSILPGFGKDKFDGRLFQTFFFNT